MNILTISLLSLIGICLLIGIIKGIGRGVGRQAVRTITIVVATIIALVITKTAGSSIFSFFASQNSESIIATIETTGYVVRGTALETIIINLDPSIVNYILAIPLTLFILPITFIVIFYILKLLMLILHVLLSGLCGFTKKRNTALTRILGAVLGAITGFAVAIVISAPVTGLLSSASQIAQTIKSEDNDEPNAIVEIYDEHIAIYANEPLSKLMSALGGKALYSQFTTFTLDEKEYNAISDIATPGADILSSTLTKLNGFDWKAPQGSNKEGLIDAISKIDESEYIKHTILSLRQTIVDIYNDGLLMIEADELLSEAVDATFSVLEKMTSESFDDDLGTLIDAYYILGREGAFLAFETGELEAVRDALVRTYTYDPLDPEYDGAGTTVIDRVVSILNTNEHTRPIVNALTKISLSALANNFGTELSTEAIYESVKTGLSDTLKIDKNSMSEEEYKNEVKNSIDAALRSSDINLRENDEYILDGMTDYIYENYDELVKFDNDGNQEITDAEINSIILSYYNAYLSQGE